MYFVQEMYYTQLTIVLQGLQTLQYKKGHQTVQKRAFFYLTPCTKLLYLYIYIYLQISFIRHLTINKNIPHKLY